MQIYIQHYTLQSVFPDIHVTGDSALRRARLGLLDVDLPLCCQLRFISLYILYQLVIMVKQVSGSKALLLGSGFGMILVSVGGASIVECPACQKKLIY